MDRHLGRWHTRAAARRRRSIGLPSVTSIAARLNGVVNPTGLSTSYHYEYGLTTTYGTNAPVPDGSIGSTLYADHVISQWIGGLQPNTTYHYRLVASNSRGTTNGTDRTFRTNATTATWSLTTVLPTTTSELQLLEVSCASASSCIAVGRISRGQNFPAVARWDGTAWSYETPPYPADAKSGELRAVSCTSTTNCVAVGSFFNPLRQPAAVKWDGRGWAFVEMPVVSEDISCTSESYCVAVGESVAATWNGASWSTQTVSAPEGGSSPRLTSVACLSEVTCMAVGRYVTGGGRQAPFSAAWNGRTWTATAMSVSGEPTEVLLKQRAAEEALRTSLAHLQPCVLPWATSPNPSDAR
jgi:hypothetical protein